MMDPKALIAEARNPNNVVTWRSSDQRQLFLALADALEAALADTARLDWLSESPGERQAAIWRAWNGETDWRDAIDAAKGKP